MSVQNPETEIAVLKTEMKNIQTQVSALKDDMNTGFREVKDLIAGLSKTSEDKYAAKWVETGLKWAVSLLVGGIIAAVLKLVLIP
jgi:glycerol-3-phosphate responsive antiterminator